MKNYEAIGVIEVKYFTNAIKILDAVCKGCDVELLHTENKLGGRLVSLVLDGDISNIQSSIEIAKSCVEDDVIKNAVCIKRPHEEIMKFIVKKELPKKKPTKKKEIINKIVNNDEKIENIEDVNKIEKIDEEK